MRDVQEIIDLVQVVHGMPNLMGFFLLKYILSFYFLFINALTWVGGWVAKSFL
jgi:hypothetical protein